MRVETLVLRTPSKEIVSARWRDLRSESVAEIASISSHTEAASEYGWTNCELMGIVDTGALGASRTAT